MRRKTIFITGATSGIGYATVKLLASKEYRVIVHGRDETSARESCKKIGLSDFTIPVWGDLSDLEQVRILADQVKGITQTIDVLILSAGLFQTGNLRSKQGFELDFAVNYLAHLLLLHLLSETLESGARVIFVSSSAYINGSVDIARLGQQHLDNPLLAYATSKVLSLIAALELSRRLADAEICVNACNPGVTLTKLLENGKRYGWRATGSSPIKAARLLEWLSLSPELNGITGTYFNGRKRPNVPKRIRSKKYTSDIYEVSVDLCGIEGFPSIETSIDE